VNREEETETSRDFTNSTGAKKYQATTKSRENIEGEREEW